MMTHRGKSRLMCMLVLAACVLLSLLITSRAGASGSGTPGQILKLFGVGGVLTSDGTLWEYRPDLGRWITIDAAFKDQGRDTHVLPLPVAAGSIREIVTFGFLLTDQGECWLYDLEKDKWEKLPSPPSR
jgi:hypothetical protein